VPREPQDQFRPPADSGLPDFARLLDADGMRGVFAEALSASGSGSGIRVADCAIERFRYRPGKRAIALFELALEDAETGASAR